MLDKNGRAITTAGPRSGAPQICWVDRHAQIPLLLDRHGNDNDYRDEVSDYRTEQREQPTAAPVIDELLRHTAGQITKQETGLTQN